MHFAWLLLLLISNDVWARPEYALRIGNNRCTSCHYSPAGGGPRTLEGKYFGAAGGQLSPASKQPYAGADIKILHYIPEKHTDSRGGTGVMAVNIFATMELAPKTDGQPEYRVLAEQNLGGFGSGPRQLYMRVTADQPLKTSWKPQHLLFGRIIPPFGLMTDEHRTYVRILTATPWNTGFDMGVLASANPYDSLHYDLAVFNGQKNNGQAPAANQATTWGGLLNLRWMPNRMPLMLGASGSYYEKEVGKDAPVAMSAYGILSFHRLTGYRFPASLLFEFAAADNWNNSTLTGQMITDAAYGTSLAKSASNGFLAQLNWDLNPKWQLNYKFDRFTPDRDFPDDYYERHGVGARHNFLPNQWVMMRVESARATHPTEKNGTKMGALDAVLIVLNLAI